MCLLLLSATAHAGTYHGVSFTADEETAVLAIANQASYETLHYTHTIFASKARTMIARRWYSDMAKLAALDKEVDDMDVVLSLLKTGANKKCAVAAPMGGVYDHVSFTDAEAHRALQAANLQSYKALVEVADVYTYKAKNIFRARPICSMAELSAVQDVTTTPMNLMKTAFTQDSRVCYNDDDCVSADRCRGTPFDGILTSGKCLEYATRAGEGTSCTAETLCHPYTGLTCNLLGATGTCRKEELSGMFTSPAHVATVTIPSGVGASATTFMAVSGLASVPENIVLLQQTLQAVANPRSVRITVTDPNGATGDFWKGYKEPTTATQIPSYGDVTGGISRDDTVNGKWTVTVTNVDGTSSGSFRFTLELSSRWD